MGFRISGKVRELESGQGIAGIAVQALDKDFLSDDLLGEVSTGPDGSYCIEYDEKSSRHLFEEKPDIYLVAKTGKGEVLHTTKDDVQVDVDRDIEINMDISAYRLVEAGLRERKPVEWLKKIDPERLKKFTTWTWRPDCDESDEIAVQLRSELSEKSSILELMKSYIDALKGNADNNAPQFIKLAKLFELGITPDKMEGHFYGVPVAIRTGDQQGPSAAFGNILGFLWGATLADTSPWVGKSFSLLNTDKLATMTGNTDIPEGPAYLGINHFNKVNLKLLNNISFQFLNLWMGLKSVPQSEKAGFGHEKNGGNFVAFKAPSVYHETEREVFQLNYRWMNIGNIPPFRWLVDEMVQVGEGIYLGQLLFATRRLQTGYDPGRPPSDYKYQHFGYFLLFDKSWNPEARRLLTHLEIPVAAPGLKKSDVIDSFILPKFSTFTFEEKPPANADDEVLAQVQNDMMGKPTIMHLFKQYSEELQNKLDNESPYFARMQEIFNRGMGDKILQGFFRQPLVTWRSDGLFKFLNTNTINLTYTQILRFNPWTGKSFEDIEPVKLKDITDGFETGETPTFWGTNTLAFRTGEEKFTSRLMKLAGYSIENVPADEAREFGYDVKTLFFIARQAKSINEHNRGKTIFQINYRWPKLKTIPPDCYCIDEVVQIAEGLYLGQLLYATELLKPYDPSTDPSEYKYRLFGYFLLMDESWHQIRLEIGFDLDNV